LAPSPGGWGNEHGTHGLFVDDCIRRDHAAGEQRERHPTCRARLAQLGGICREKESSPDHERRAAHRDDARPLAEQRDSDEHGEEGAGRSRQRIDDRKVGVAVASVEQKIISRMEHGARDDEGERGRRKVEMLKVYDRRRKGGVEKGRQRRKCQTKPMPPPLFLSR